MGVLEIHAEAGDRPDSETSSFESAIWLAYGWIQLRELTFRIQLDRYSAFYGVLISHFVCRPPKEIRPPAGQAQLESNAEVPSEYANSTAFKMSNVEAASKSVKINYSSRSRASVLDQQVNLIKCFWFPVLGVFLLGSFSELSSAYNEQHNSKNLQKAYNSKFHPYFCWVPILAY